MPETVDLFFYGTLRDPEVRRVVLGPAAVGQSAVAATISGYRCAPVAGGRFPALVPEEGGSASGQLVAAVPLEAAARASVFEDDGHEYLAREVTVAPVQGAVRTAWAFLAGAAISPEPGEWSMEVWSRRHRADFLAGCRDTMARVEPSLLAQHRAAWRARLRGV